ncbi:undecaprenyl/decaprenyl-phosphate alpha-N-acetylglucosaminyl 1-phosphate transferase [Candidatus Peribacteria bacterium]|nr:undecaprenyl/decaprenyl-phosphate alpha-N-acetylglucosaminyl 1-phosphate transferase [Candidatus Peribacteria bacterium]
MLHLIALRDFPTIGLLDFPKRYGLSRNAIPYPTGILSILTFLLIFGYTAPWTLQSAGIAISILLLTLISFLDDRYTIHPAVRLVGQALIAFIIFATGSRIYTLTNPLLADGMINLDTINILFPLSSFRFPLVLPLWSGIFTIIWLMITMNALNWFDGIPGQVSTLSTIGFLVIGSLAMSDRVQQPEVALIAFILAGIAAAGLLFDFPPNKVLMGDTGAMFFGLMLGVLTIYSGGKVATAFLVLGVPLIDLAIVIVRRILKKHNPLRGNSTDEHLHHRLLRKRWSSRMIITLTAGLGTLFGTAALFFSTTQKMVAAGVLFAVMLLLSLYTSKS